MKYIEFQPTNITTATTTQVATGQGTLHTIVVNATAAGTIILIDGIATGSTTVIGTLKASVAEGTYEYDCVFSKGLRVTTGATSDITVNWAQG